MKHTAIATLLAAALLASAPACYGSYSAFHSLHDWNGKVSSDKWGRSAVPK